MQSDLDLLCTADDVVKAAKQIIGQNEDEQDDERDSTNRIDYAAHGTVLIRVSFLQPRCRPFRM